MAILPLHVIDPLLSANNDQPWSWQNHIKKMMQGRPYKGGREGRMLWNWSMWDVERIVCASKLVGANCGTFSQQQIDGESSRGNCKATNSLFPSYGDWREPMSTAFENYL